MNKHAVTLSVLALVSSAVLAQAPGKGKKPARQVPVKAAPAKSGSEKSAPEQAGSRSAGKDPGPVVFTYGSDTVYKSEFERLLLKNRNQKETPTEESVREYLELYQNFKMKVKEAKLMQLDTNTAFKTELAGYRKQLANPYLTDKKATEGLMREAYDHMLTEVEASHILILCGENAKPADTLTAYNKALELRKRYLKGESFDSLAYRESEDQSARNNYGKLGWFSGFDMIYSFEKMAYQTPVGEVSMPFRTSYGYHIIKVSGKRPARGEVKLQHIMRTLQRDPGPEQVAEQKQVIDSVYAMLKAGAAFDDMVARYSQDEGSKPNKGVMNWIPANRLPEQFKDPVYELKNEAFSKPIRTPFGYHIVKLLEIKPIAPYKDLEESIKSKVTRDSRAESSKASVVQRIKNENNFREYPANLKAFATSGVDSSIFMAGYEYKESNFPGKTLFSLGEKTYTDRDFARYLISSSEGYEPGQSVFMKVNNIYKRYVEEQALAYEEARLEDKYEDFRNLMQEYHDGILLFDLTDKKVWDKAIADTIGLEKFHEANKKKYMWKERVHVLVFSSLDAKTKKAAMKMAQAGKSVDEIKAKLNKKITGAVVVTEMKAEQGESAETDKLYDKQGVVDIPDQNNQYRFYYVKGIVAPEPKMLKEAKGMVTSDYQNYLEKEWIRELRAKYPVTVNEEIVKTLFK